MKVYYNRKLKILSRNLRNKSTPAEVLFWNYIKGKKFHGLQFMRQKPIGNYIVDFYCSRLKLIIEIDGSTHINLDKDNFRESILSGKGFKIIRFKEIDVKQNIEAVLEYLNSWISRNY